MRRKIIKFIANCNGKTRIDKLKRICTSEDELNFALSACLSLIQNHTDSDDEIPTKWKTLALQAFETVPKEKITCPLIQKELGVGFNVAWRLKDWIVKTK